MSFQESSLTAMGKPRIGALHFDALDETGTIDAVLDAWQAGRGGWLVNPNIDVLRQVGEDPDVARLASSANLVVADGVPILWAARLAGQPLPGLVAGSDLIWSLSRAAHTRGAGVFLLGGAPGVAETAALRMAREIPGLVPGHYSPPFGFEKDDAEMAELRRVLAATSPDIVFCGFGFPKQERLMALLAPEMPTTWFIGTGASISFVAGATTRAPAWMRGTGLEWLHRLRSEPRRLFRRYVLLDAPFALRLLRPAFLALAKRRLCTRPLTLSG